MEDDFKTDAKREHVSDRNVQFLSKKKGRLEVKEYCVCHEDKRVHTVRRPCLKWEERATLIL